MNVRVRFPPSPTGELHLGGLRTALYNYLFARKSNGVFVLRIEDTDKSREVPGAAARIAATLEQLGLHYDEGPEFNDRGTVIGERGSFGPYIQSARIQHYKETAERLVESGNAYWCDCAPERLETLRKKQEQNKERIGYDGHCRERGLTKKEGSVIRLKVPKETIEFHDLIHGNISVDLKDIDDQVLLKSDGYPTYHLAVVVDDTAMEISHIIRGEDWLPSTPKHILLYRFLGFTPPLFAHLPLLRGTAGGKLSKREGGMSVARFLQEGYLPEAIINFVALLGWNPRGDQELYTLDELIASFDLTKVNKNAAAVDLKKLEWMNREYLLRLNGEQLIETILPALHAEGLIEQEENLFIPKEGGRAITGSQLEAIIRLGLERSSTIAGCVGEIRFFFEAPRVPKEILVWKKQSPAELKENFPLLIASLDAHADWNAQAIADHLKDFCTERSLAKGSVFWPVRVALSGREGSPAPEVIAEYLGKTETLQRLRRAYEAL